jgi:hypothetical protein
MFALDRYAAWPARILWVVLAVAAAGPIGDALDGRSTAVRWVAVIGLWVGWTVAAVCLLVLRDVFLTGLRILVPAGLAAVLAALVVGDGLDAVDLLAVALAALASAWVLTPWVGEAWIDGSSYGPEQRLPLRPPVLFSAVVVPLTWTLVVAGASVGPLLLAARAWLPGAVLTVAGAGLAFAGARSLHQLSRRWVVLVPAGMVLHDGLVMPEPQLFLRHTVVRLGPALVDGGEPDDLTAGAPGLALRLDLNDPVELLVRRGGRTTETVTSTAVLFTPSRPRRLLDAAAKRRIPVG